MLLHLAELLLDLHPLAHLLVDALLEQVGAIVGRQNLVGVDGLGRARLEWPFPLLYGGLGAARCAPADHEPNRGRREHQRAETPERDPQQVRVRERCERRLGRGGRRIPTRQVGQGRLHLSWHWHPLRWLGRCQRRLRLLRDLGRLRLARGLHAPRRGNFGLPLGLRCPFELLGTGHRLGSSDHPSLLELSLADAAVTVVGAGTNQDLLGERMSDGGDVDGDGLIDVLVSARWDSSVTVAGGTVFLLSGTTTGTLAADDLDTAFTSNEDIELGDGLAFPGDVDGDGLDDVAVSSERERTHGSHSGAVWVFTGVAAEHVSIEDATATLLGGKGERAGSHLAGMGDIDGDGHAELAVGVPRAFGSGDESGLVYVVGGPLSGTTDLADSATATLSGPQADLRVGERFTAVRDADFAGAPALLVASGDYGIDGTLWLVPRVD